MRGVRVAPAISIGANRGISELGRPLLDPMPPMVPMPFIPAGPLGASRRSPFADGRLPREHQPGDPSAGESFRLGRDVLPTSPLWIEDLPDVWMKLACGDRLLAMLLPPCGEHLGGRLPASVAFLGLADPLDRIPASEPSRGSRTHRHQASKLPSGRPARTVRRARPQRQMVKPPQAGAPDCRRHLAGCRW